MIFGSIKDKEKIIGSEDIDKLMCQSSSDGTYKAAILINFLIK